MNCPLQRLLPVCTPTSNVWTMYVPFIVMLNPYASTYRRTCFTALCRCVVLQIEGLWQPCVRQVCWLHFSVAFAVSHFDNSWQYFRLFHYCYICCGLWSVILEVTNWNCFGHHDLRWYKTVNLILKCCVYSGCFTEWLFPPLSPSLWASLFPESTILKLGQLVTLQCSSERKSCTSHFKSKARND